MAKIDIDKVAKDKVQAAIDIGNKQIKETISIIKEVSETKRKNILGIIETTRQEITTLEQILHSVEDIYGIKESKNKELQENIKGWNGRIVELQDMATKLRSTLDAKEKEAKSKDTEYKQMIKECEDSKNKLNSKKIPNVYKAALKSANTNELRLIYSCTRVLTNKEDTPKTDIDTLWKSSDLILFKMTDFMLDPISVQKAERIRDEVNSYLPDFDITANPKLAPKFSDHYYIARWTISACKSVILNESINESNKEITNVSM